MNVGQQARPRDFRLLDDELVEGELGVIMPLAEAEGLERSPD